MSKVPEHLIEEARKRGIVPGARIMQFTGAYIGEEFTVGDYSQWNCFERHWFSVGKAKEMSLFAMHMDEWAAVITPAPSQKVREAAARLGIFEGLKEGDAVECGPAMRAAIIELAKELGVDVQSIIINAQQEYPNLVWRGQQVRGTYGTERKNSGQKKQWHTPEAFIAKMRVTAAQPKPIKIGDHTVKFNADKSITVGCTTVPFTTIETIYNKIK